METIISIPHSSTFIDKKYHYQFLKDIDDINKHIDFAVDKICKLKDYKVIEAEVSRFVVDLNRERHDTGSDQGVIINKNWHGKPVLKRKLTDKEINDRLVHYDNFYLKLKELLISNKNIFLIDCHSMDSKNISDNSMRPHICLANNFGKSCPNRLTEIFKSEFKKHGYWTEENNPYSGKRANIIRFANEHSVPALELEFNKSIYMDEKTLILKEEEIENLRNIFNNVLEIIKNIN